jgi:hypothetical protein
MLPGTLSPNPGSHSRERQGCDPRSRCGMGRTGRRGRLSRFTAACSAPALTPPSYGPGWPMTQNWAGGSRRTSSAPAAVCAGRWISISSRSSCASSPIPAMRQTAGPGWAGPACARTIHITGRRVLITAWCTAGFQRAPLSTAFSGRLTSRSTSGTRRLRPTRHRRVAACGTSAEGRSNRVTTRAGGETIVWLPAEHEKGSGHARSICGHRMLTWPTGCFSTCGSRRAAAAGKGEASRGSAAGVPGSQRRAAPPHPARQLWPFLAPDSGEFYRWRVQLDCNCITEVLTRGPDRRPGDAQWPDP